MKATKYATLGFVMLGVAACANVERSRNLNDPSVTAKSMAQQVCSACHGVDGNSISPNFPNLASQTELYMVSQLKEFRNHSRSDPAGFEYMWGLSRHLTDEQINGLASYFSGQILRPVQAGDVQVIAGKKIFEGGVPEKNIPACLACHGDHGQGKDQTPRIAGQHADYLVKQLSVFQRTDKRPDGAVMKIIAHDLTQANKVDVATYLQALVPK